MELVMSYSSNGLVNVGDEFILVSVCDKPYNERVIITYITDNVVCWVFQRSKIESSAHTYEVVLKKPKYNGENLLVEFEREITKHLESFSFNSPDITNKDLSNALSEILFDMVVGDESINQ